MRKISVLVPTNKPDFKPILSIESDEILLSTIKGITASRIDLMNRAKNDFLIMMDDDVTIKKEVFEYAQSIPQGYFLMSYGDNHPVTWLLAIHKKDYDDVQFNPEFNYAVDIDFYYRALKVGLNPILIKTGINHKEHPRRYDINRFIESGKVRAYNTRLIIPHYFILPIMKLEFIRFVFQTASLFYYLGKRIIQLGIWRINRNLISKNLRLRYALREIKKTTKNKKLVGVEVGVFKGENAENILRNMNIEKLYLIDPYSEYADYDIYTKKLLNDAKQEAENRLEKYSDKIIWINKPFSADLFNELLDFVYIDGNHNYESVKRDIKEAKKIIKHNGIISGHDYFPPGSKDRKRFGVSRAVEEEFKTFSYIEGEPDWIIYNPFFYQSLI